MENDLPAANFDKVLSIIQESHDNALKAVNTELIKMYWRVGEYLSALCASAQFGDKVIDEVASYIARTAPEIKAFIAGVYIG